MMALLALCHACPGCAGPTVGSDPTHVEDSSETPPAIGAANQENPAPWVQFRDEATQRGLTYQWPKKPRPMRNLEAFGTGCAFFDYNNDGWQDAFLVGEPHPVLYRNRGRGFFEDVTLATGLAELRAEWKGCAVGDVDGDGWLDLLLTGYRCLALLRNVRGERFENVTKAFRLDPENRQHWGSGTGFMDLDNDGDLDLIVLNYVVFGPDQQQYCEFGGGIKAGCPPHVYRPEPPELWRNEGDRFVDWTAPSGFNQSHGKGLVLAFCDVDRNGFMDFYVGNDGEPGEFWINHGDLKLEDLGPLSGLAGGWHGGAMAAMCADWGDFDLDGRMDLIVSDFSGAPYALFRQTADLLFQDYSGVVGIREPTLNALGFGGKWLDMDNDGWVDICFVNGHVYDNVEQFNPNTTFLQPTMLFYNHQGQRFTDLMPFLSTDVGKPILGRGLACGDIDNDGRVDLLIVDYEGPVMLLHNSSTTNHHWVNIEVRGNAPNTFAYGAFVTVEANGVRRMAHVSPASSYLSSSDPRIHFGLGTTSQLEVLTVRWLSGREHTFRNLPADHFYQVTEDGKLYLRKPQEVGRWTAVP
jgi:hypothetical protein